MEVSGRNLIIVADTTFTTVKTYRKNITNVSFRQFFPKYLQNTSLMKWVLSMDTSLGKFPTINPVFLFAQFSHSCRWTNLFAANLTWLPHSFKLSWLVLKADILHMIWLMVFFSAWPLTTFTAQKWFLRSSSKWSDKVRDKHHQLRPDWTPHIFHI